MTFFYPKRIDFDIIVDRKQFKGVADSYQAQLSDGFHTQLVSGDPAPSEKEALLSLRAAIFARAEALCDRARTILQDDLPGLESPATAD